MTQFKWSNMTCYCKLKLKQYTCLLKLWLLMYLFLSANCYFLRLRDLYQGIAYPRICITNSWICIVSGITKQIQTSKGSIWIVDQESSKFSDSTCFHKSSRIFSTIPQNESFKIQIRNSWILTNPDWRICESTSLNIWFVDSFWKNKNPQILDSYWFVGIRPWIPQPYHYL